MSVILLEVLENAGYDIKNNIDDARWFLSQKDKFDELYEEVEELNEQYEEYEDFMDAQEEWDFDTPTFEEWREEKENGT